MQVLSLLYIVSVAVSGTIECQSGILKIKAQSCGVARGGLEESAPL